MPTALVAVSYAVYDTCGSSRDFIRRLLWTAAVGPVHEVSGQRQHGRNNVNNTKKTTTPGEGTSHVILYLNDGIIIRRVYDNLDPFHRPFSASGTS